MTTVFFLFWSLVPVLNKSEHLIWFTGSIFLSRFPGFSDFTRCSGGSEESSPVFTQPVRLSLSFHSPVKVYQSQPELAASVICNLTAWPSTNNPFVSLLKGFWGLFSVSWKEEVKPNDLGQCVVLGKEVPARWRWLQPGPGGFGEICQRQLPFLNPAKEKDLLNRVTFHQCLAATGFHFTMFFPPVLKLKYHIQQKFILFEMQTWKWEEEPCHGGV